MIARRGMVRRRPLLRAAVVGGGAYMAGKSTARRQAQSAEQDASQEARISDLEQGQQAPAPPADPAPAAAPAGSAMTDQLSELSRMHEAGALTDEEFSAAKARLLG